MYVLYFFMKLDLNIKPETLHVAMIMDGNGRWANERALARLKGHAKGADRVRHIVRASLDMNVTHLTLFAFSTENWKRSESEVIGLMSLFRKFMKSESKKLFINGVKVRFIGDRNRLDKSLIGSMNDLEVLTNKNDNLHLTIALNYGGRDEIIRATKKISEKIKSGELELDDISIELFSNNLDTFDLPDPDLVIRTSGEKRTSNFLPWQCAYSEYVFEESNWPDFNKEIYEEILKEFKSREVKAFI
jgi:undecaprenyl diphosphate synthase